MSFCPFFVSPKIMSFWAVLLYGTGPGWGGVGWDRQMDTVAYKVHAQRGRAGQLGTLQGARRGARPSGQ